MDFEESLAAFLTLWGVSAYTHSDGGREVHPLTLPQPAYFPAVCWDIVDSNEVEDQDGFTRLVRADLDLDCWARTMPEARQLAREVSAGLRSQKMRPKQPFVDGGPTIHGLNNLKPGIPDYSDGDKAFVVTVQCTVWYEEAA